MVVPVHDYADVLTEALESVRTQTLPISTSSARRPPPMTPAGGRGMARYERREI